MVLFRRLSENLVGFMGTQKSLIPNRPSTLSSANEKSTWLSANTLIFSDYYDSIPKDGDNGAHALWLERAEYDTIRAILKHKAPLPSELLNAVIDFQT
jgi:hypothetical protein